MSGPLIHVPPSWREAVALVASGDVQRPLMLGPPDIGKSTFCRLLLAELARSGRSATLLDTDLGQKIIGPPACVTVGSVDCDGGARGAALAFVGTVDPVRGWTRLLHGMRSLAARFELAGGPLVVNTSGLLRGPGRALKAAKIAALRPDLLIALGSDPHLDAILADHPDLAVMRLPSSPLARRKTDAQRRAARCATFRAYLAGCPTWTLQGARVLDEPDSDAADFPAGLLVGLADAAGQDLGAGVVAGESPTRGAVVLMAPDLRPRASALRRGWLVLGPEVLAQAGQWVEPNRPAGIGGHRPRRTGPAGGPAGWAAPSSRSDTMASDFPKPPFPEQSQPMPGSTAAMKPRPDHGEDSYKGSGRLLDKKAIITGGDSGIGRAVAIAFAREGADVLISYLNEHDDARETEQLVQAAGRKAVLMPGDIQDPAHCRAIVDRAVQEFGRVDILVNNAAHQASFQSIDEISDEEWELTFRTNIHAMFYLTKAAVPHMPEGSAIINTTSVNADNPSPELLAYATTKGAIQNFTAGLSQLLAEKGIRVNCVAPGPIWTPLIPSTMPTKKVTQFGAQVPMKRPGQPKELAPVYVMLASPEASYVSGATIAVTGGKPIL